MLSVKALRYGHRGRALAMAIDFDVRPGEVVAILGPNGCGKTTLFRTLLGLIPAIGGEVLLDAENLLAQPRRQIARRIAYVPQAHAGIFSYRVEDVVLMGRAPHLGPFAVPSARDRAAALAALQRLRIEAMAARPYTEISGGERQLVLIARALAQEASVVVMDEPTASLDFGNQRLVLAEIDALRSRAIAVLMSTHQPEHVLRVADRVALLSRFGLEAFGPAATVLTASRLASLYDVPIDEIHRSLPMLAR